jgi:hypothetical protein
MLAMMEAGQTENLTLWIGAFSLGSVFITIGGQWFSTRHGHPLLEITTRWSRLIAISFSITYAAFAMDWAIATNRPPWSLAAFLLLGCVLFVTINIWFKVRGFSNDDGPLFPRYHRNQETDEWPTSPNHIRLREWIREQGYRQVDSLLAYPVPETCIREFHFDSKDNLTRFCVSFIPRGVDRLYVAHSASSVTEDGDRYVTDNAFAPFGGYSPDHWKIDRRPFNRSPKNLLERHQKSMKSAGKQFTPWLDSPADDVKEQHRLLEKENRDRGILNPRQSWEEYGRFSQEGCYRMWKEILLLNYFGVVV